jgi:drug/metabolite transporter (DMT)-like permease
MPIANATAILQSVPLAVTLGAALFLGERVGWRRYLAIVAGFMGVLIIVRPGTEGFDAYALWALGRSSSS